MNYLSGIETVIKAVSDVLTAGVAIISFSLFIYAVTFKLHDRVTISFSFLILCIVVIYGSDSFLAVVQQTDLLRLILKIHWLGIVFLPTVYFHFSDALLAITGKPSRGRRRLVGMLCILVSLVFSALLFTDMLVGNLVTDKPPAPYLERTIFNDLFSGFFLIVMGLSWYNFIRAFNRTITRTSRRRMLYLITSALGPALGSFPYLLYGLDFAAHWPFIFWGLSVLSYTFVFITLISMTYAVSFFGFPWADRVIKSRLFRWVMRGPITASLTLGVTTIITRLGKQYGVDVSAVLVLAMVAVIVLFEYSVTLFANIWERFLFGRGEREELVKIRSLEDKLLTFNDMRQFLELILATLCDLLRVQGACLLIKNEGGDGLVIQTGKLDVKYSQEKEKFFNLFEGFSPSSIETFTKMEEPVYALPLMLPEDEAGGGLLGVLIVENLDQTRIDPEKEILLKKLIGRAILALRDRTIQEGLFVSLDMLTPQVSIIQDLLASSRFDQNKIYDEHTTIKSEKFDQWVKDALDHLWGGPRLSQSPLLRLNLIAQRVKSEQETPINVLRELLRTAITQLKPEGDRQYTNEWILYNLLDLKYLSGWKVKDIARKLALSEADLYRKQRIAISSVAEQIIVMEKDNTTAG